MASEKKKPNWRHKRKMGLVLHGGYFCYGWKHGWIPWAPEWFKHAVVHVWNSMYCMRHGHDDMLVDLYKAFIAEGEIDPEPPSCGRCLTELPVDGKYVTPVKAPWWTKPPSKEEIAEWKELALQPDLPEDSPDPS
jgi:hypothetical protein